MQKGFGCLVAFAAFAALLVISGAFYKVEETEQVIITQFGKSIGEPVTTPGLKFKVPFLHKVNPFEKRILAWDGPTTEMPTKDKTYIRVDSYARWAISDPLRYFEKLRDEGSAKTRLDDILGSETRNTIAKHELIEVIRTTKDRQPQVEEELAEADKTGVVGQLIPISRGRSELEKEILTTAQAKLHEFGIELLDVRFKRINYNESVQERIFERMISERQQIAERFRSEGAGEAAKILGDMEKELRTIESEAYKTVEITKGEADAEATTIYADAFGKSDEAAEFYEFVRTLELYGAVMADSTVVLSTDSDLFKYLKSVKPVVPSNSEDAVVPVEGAEANAVQPPARQRRAPQAPAPEAPAPQAPAQQSPAPADD
ncbi:MAG: protease modulator HflC [Verrucomicrobiales bacterium]